MVRFIKVVNTCDKIVDCIPIASTVKNGGILLYQLAHKVNKVANPVKTSWTTDIKIHALSKDAFLTGISMIPILGNCVAFVYHLINAVVQARGVKPMSYIGEATVESTWGVKKHGYEIVALYLARNPNRSEEKLCKDLRFAAICGKEEIVQSILHSRTNWSSNTIEQVLTFIKDTETAKMILEKYSNILTDEQAGSILRFLADNSKQNNYIELLITTFPNIDMHHIGWGLESAAGKKDAFNNVCLLLNRFPKIEEAYIAKALEKASKEGCKDIIEVLLQHFPNLVTTHMDRLLEEAASRGDMVIVNWLLTAYKENISSTSIGKALASAQKGIYWGKDDEHLVMIKDLIGKYPNLPGKDLEPAMERVGSFGDKMILNCLLTAYKENISSTCIGKALASATLMYLGGADHLLMIKELIDKYPNLPGKDLEPTMEKAAWGNLGLFKFYLKTFSQLQPENLQKILNEAVFAYGTSKGEIPTADSKRWDEVAQLIKEKFPKMEAVDPFDKYFIKD